MGVPICNIYFRNEKVRSLSLFLIKEKKAKNEKSIYQPYKAINFSDNNNN